MAWEARNFFTSQGYLQGVGSKKEKEDVQYKTITVDNFLKWQKKRE